jgi:hypothetical protein
VDRYAGGAASRCFAAPGRLAIARTFFEIRSAHFSQQPEVQI